MSASPKGSVPPPSASPEKPPDKNSDGAVNDGVNVADPLGLGGFFDGAGTAQDGVKRSWL